MGALCAHALHALLLTCPPSHPPPQPGLAAAFVASASGSLEPKLDARYLAGVTTVGALVGHAARAPSQLLSRRVCSFVLRDCAVQRLQRLYRFMHVQLPDGLNVQRYSAER